MPGDGAGLTVEVRRVRIMGEPLDQISAGMTRFSRCDGWIDEGVNGESVVEKKLIFLF